MSANVPATGKARSLETRDQSEQPFTERDLVDAVLLVRILKQLLRDVRDLKRQWAPNRIDFEGRLVLGDGTTKYRFEHGFTGPVRFWVVDWIGAAAPNLRRHTDSDARTLVLTSTSEGTVTLRIEEAG